ncbi:MAG: TolC family protein [Gammaproteobacteria bacterium]|nr:MAG: TolC family protein [Gammaproteobacteria bacterium]
MAWPVTTLRGRSSFLLGCLLLALSGCGLEHYREAPLEPVRSADEYLSRGLDVPVVRDLFLKEGHDWPPARWDGEALVLAARALNPSLVVARAEVAVAEAEVVRAGAGIDPSAGGQAEHHSLRQEGSFWSLGGFLELVFERPAKRQARIAHARAALEGQRMALQEAQWRIRGEVLDAWELLRHRQRMNRIVHRRLELLERMKALLERRYELGESGGFELDTLRLELLRARIELRRSESELHAGWRELARRVGVTEEKLHAVVQLPDAAPPPAAGLPDPGLLQRRMLHQHASILRALQDYAVVDAGLRLAVEEQYPDLKLSPGYLFDQGDNVWSLTGALTLPLLRNHTGAIEKARREREREAARFRALQAELIARLRAAHGAARDTDDALEEARLLLQAAHRREQRMRRNYELGESDVLDWLRSRLQTLEAEAAVERMAHEQRSGRLGLEQASQVRLGEPAAGGDE